MRSAKWIGLACLFLTLASPAIAEDFEIHRDVVYGHKMGMALTFDVIQPEKANGAGVLFMVSGGWVSRWIDPDQVMASGDAFGPFGQLTQSGYTLFLVRHGSSPLFKVPDAVADVRRAVRYIRKNSAEYGVDQSRLGVFGGSAGGHLSLMLGNASDEGDPDSKDPLEQVGNRVAAVVAYFPPVDLQGLTGPNDRFPALDFEPEKAKDISPVFFVTKDDPPTLLVHGDKDPLVPLAHSERIHKAFSEAGVASDLVVIEGAPHGFRGEHADIAGKALIAWFDEHLSVPSAAPTSP